MYFDIEDISSDKSEEFVKALVKEEFNSQKEYQSRYV